VADLNAGQMNSAEDAHKEDGDDHCTSNQARVYIEHFDNCLESLLFSKHYLAPDYNFSNDLSRLRICAGDALWTAATNMSRRQKPTRQ